jgi:hypothetical protein
LAPLAEKYPFVFNGLKKSRPPISQLIFVRNARYQTLRTDKIWNRVFSASTELRRSIF